MSRDRDNPLPGAVKMDGLMFRLGARDLVGVATEIASAHGVTLADLLGPSRKRGPAAARHAFWHHLNAEVSMGSRKIAVLWGGKTDHTTVLHGIDAHLNRQPRVKPTMSSVAALPCGPVRWDRASREEAMEGGANV